MRLRLATALAVVVPLVGCGAQQGTGTDDFSGQEKAVAEVIAELSDDAARGRESNVCGELITEELQKTIAGDASCPGEVKEAFDDADNADIVVDDVTVEGTTARAAVSTEARGDDVERTFELEKVGDDWRISSFG